MPDSLSVCYENLAELLGSDREPISVIQRAEEHRSYWRPSTPRVILLAESHVYTHKDELLRNVRLSPPLPGELPTGFVRLVYCLGYGEDQALCGPAPLGRNGGTPQFWKIFLSCLKPITRNEDFAVVQATKTPFRERIANKISILDQLRASGVWLLDASIAALYTPGRPKPAAQVVHSVLQESWDSYIRSVIAEAAPEAILCIGLGVGRSLAFRLNQLGTPWAAVPQPQARLSSAAHFRIFETYRRVCADPAQIRFVPNAWDWMLSPSLRESSAVPLNELAAG